jgi:hypothetical protein
MRKNAAVLRSLAGRSWAGPLKQFAIVDAAQQPSSEWVEAAGGDIGNQLGGARGRNVHSVVKGLLNVREIGLPASE